MNKTILWIVYYWNEMLRRIWNEYKNSDKETRRCIYGIIILFAGVFGFNFVKYSHLKKLYSFLIYPFLAIPTELHYPLRII